MKPDRWHRVKRVFQDACERPPEERERWLAEACAGDRELEREVRELLAAHRPDDRFLAEPPAAAAAEALAERSGEAGDRRPPALEGRRLGPYRIVRRVGHGGIGAVYLAVRDDAFKKRVAVKVIRPGMATREVLARFRGERQILASIEHPNIARQVDGGATPEGLPYLVMEYIEGMPIDAYCEAGSLALDRRLELFVEVCEAVQVAHQNLVVHRDIKPGNILVTADGTPKLLDFGIAKILDPDLAAGMTEVTRQGMRVLTPEFASPEQLRGDRITTASDVYSLGALLYLLLCGETPHEVAGLPIAEVARRVAEREPPRPSERSGERALRGDLDNIVLKALRKEPERRYASPGQLASDLRRHLEDLPVEARPDTLGYRAGKFVRRHRAAVASTGLALLATLGLLVSMALQSARLERERGRAERQAARATAVSEFLQGVLVSADPYRGMAHDARLVDALDAAAARVEGAFPGAPEQEAAVRHSVGQTYLRLGRYRDAEPQLETALALRRELPAEGLESLLESLAALGALRQELGDYPAAESLYREGLERAETELAPAHPWTARLLGRLATVRHDLGDGRQAESFYRRSLEMRRALFGADHEEVATALDDLANLLHDRGDLDGAEAMYRRALEIRRAALAPDHPDLSTSLNNLGLLLHDRGRLDDAEPLYRESLAMAERRLGEEHPDVASSLNNLAALLHDRERFEDAERLYRRSLETTRRLFGDEHPRTADALQNLAVLLDDRDRPDEAEALYRQAVAIQRRALGEGHASVALATENLAELLAERGDRAEAERLLRRSLAAGHDAGVGDRDLAIRLHRLAVLLAEAEEGGTAEGEEAAVLFEQALARAERAPAEASLLAEIRLDAAGCLRRLGRIAEARRLLTAAAASLTDADPADRELLQEISESLAQLAAASE